MAAHETTVGQSGRHPRDAGRWPRERVAAVAVAALGQTLVLLVTFSLGLVWGGWTYALATLVALVALVGLFVRPPRGHGRGASLAPLAVPLVSGAVTGLLFQVGTWMEVSGACTDTERAAVESLRDPAGRSLQLEGTYDGECLARPDMGSSARAGRRHYLAQLAADGWRVVEQDPRLVVAEKDDITLAVELVPTHDMALVSVRDRSR